MLLISKCLAGHPCRYDGKAKGNDTFIKLCNEKKALPFCPECAGGLTFPREPSELTGSGELVLCRKAKAVSKSGLDLSDQFITGAERTLLFAKEYGINLAILKSKSPSCGCGLIYDGTFKNRLVPGDGVTTALLKQNGICVISDEEFLLKA
ncbi:MAG: DUF523 domain-containing protein [Clostridia bacterium]|nr:DUF523 domain-containing protein [Clostridia bacterium]